MHVARTQYTIGVGFFAIAALFFAVVAIWLVMVANNNHHLHRLNFGESQRQLVFTMRDAAYQRNLALFRMAVLRDVFARDSEYLRFKASAGDFIAARQQLLQNFNGKDTAEHWRRLKPLIQRSEKLQNSIVDSIMEDNNTAALRLIQQEFIPTQRQVSRELNSMLDSAREDSAEQLQYASATTQTQYRVILLMVLLATSIGYIIAKAVLRRSQEAESVLIDKNRQFRALNDATSDSRDTIAEQIDRILKLGCEFLAMECAMVVGCDANHTAAISACFPQEQVMQIPNLQKLAERIQRDMERSPLLVTATSALDTDQAFLRDTMAAAKIKSIIASPLTTNSPVKHNVVFTHAKSTQFPLEANELLQLCSNKLAVLIDQQETLAQLHKAKHAAETANKAKNVFLANLSDELRTPLDSIVDHVFLLQEKTRQQKHSEYVNDLDKIQEASQHLGGLFSNLLDMAQLESGSMAVTCQPMDIEPLLQDIQNQLAPAFANNDNQFQSHILNELGTIHSDSDRIRQILTSLLSFTTNLSRQGNISLTAWRESCPEDDWLYLEVKGTGHGISKKQINHLFKLVTAATADQDKTTLGPAIRLAISKKICELLGGNILVDSTPNQGTTFTVCLPCHSQQGTEVATA